MKIRRGDETKAVGYLRTSTEEQNLGPEAQRAAIERWSQSNGVTIVAWHEDRLGGATGVEDRPGLLAAFESLKGASAGLLVAAKRDRIARDVIVAATVERIAQDCGARVVTTDGVSAEDTPEGKLMRTLMDAFAAYERAVIRARTRAALAVKKARGERISGRAPVGYRFDTNGKLVMDPREQMLLSEVRGLRERGYSIQRVANLLNSRGVRLRGGKLHPTTLARCLRRAA
jgi:site-specific DNA recombinase